jgi:hypothetical protein
MNGTQTPQDCLKNAWRIIRRKNKHGKEKDENKINENNN